MQFFVLSLQALYDTFVVLFVLGIGGRYSIQNLLLFLLRKVEVLGRDLRFLLLSFLWFLLHIGVRLLSLLRTIG